MEKIDSKNMIVLKDLPSNIVKEAYIVFKSNKMIKKIQRIKEKEQKNKNKQQRKDEEYAIKEAEMLVLDYIQRAEKSEKEIILNSKINRKFKKYVYITSVIIFIQFILLIAK